MSRYLGPKCRLCRREKTKLFLKGKRCISPKCPLDKKGAVPPGSRSSGRFSNRLTEYGEQLREKQKIKRIYGIYERQLKKYFLEARKEAGATGKTLLRLLELRLDNVLFRLGFVSSRMGARQLIKHGGIRINSKKVDIPSYRVKKEDLITLSSMAVRIPEVKESLGIKDFKTPAWLERKSGAGKVLDLPGEDDLSENVNEQLIVEFYSRS